MPSSNLKFSDSSEFYTMAVRESHWPSLLALPYPTAGTHVDTSALTYRLHEWSSANSHSLATHQAQDVHNGCTPPSGKHPPREVDRLGSGNGLDAVQAENSRVLGTWVRLGGQMSLAQWISYIKGGSEEGKSGASRAQESRQGAHLPDLRMKSTMSFIRRPEQLEHMHTHIHTHAHRSHPFTAFICHLSWTPVVMHIQSIWNCVVEEEAELVTLGPAAESYT